MTSFKKYFFYHFKSTLLRSTIVGAFFVLFILTVSLNPHEFRSWFIEVKGVEGLLFCLFNLCIIIPILELSDFKIRRNMDSLLSIPIDRKKLAVAHYVNGFVQITAIYLLCAIITLFRYLSNPFDFKYFVLFFFHSLFIGLIFYSFVVFTFNIGNSIFDGILIMLLWACLEIVFLISLEFASLLNLLSALMSPKINSILHDFLEGFLSWASPFYELCNYEYYIRIEYSSLQTPSLTFNSIYFWKLFLLTALAGAMIFGYIKMFQKQKVEKIGGISDSGFGYKLLVPFYGISLAFISSLTPALFFAPAAGMAIGYIIYRRSFKFKRLDFLLMGIATVISAIFLIFDLNSVFSEIALDILLKKYPPEFWY